MDVLCLVWVGCLFNGSKTPAPPPPLEGRGLGGGVGVPAPRGLKGCEGVRTALRRLLGWGVRLGCLPERTPLARARASQGRMDKTGWVRQDG